jgi:hypothetical protein
MNKSKKRVNALINRKGLFREIKEKGINRVSKKAEELLEGLVFESVEKMLEGLKEEMEISGKRILDEDVIKSFIKNRDKKEEFDY